MIVVARFTIVCLPFAIYERKTEICKTISFIAVSRKCETWLLQLKEEHRMKIFENRVLMIILSQKTA
jgi:hypothetical protein